MQKITYIIHLHATQNIDLHMQFYYVMHFKINKSENDYFPLIKNLNSQWKLHIMNFNLPSPLHPC